MTITILNVAEMSPAEKGLKTVLMICVLLHLQYVLFYYLFQQWDRLLTTLKLSQENVLLSVTMAS